MNSLHKKTLKKHSGFTLIEIMVALAIGAVLIGGISQVYLSLKQTNKVSFALSRLQEGARIANDTFIQEVSHAGYIGCLDPMKDVPSVIYTSAPTWVENFTANSISGWDVTNTGWGSSDGLGDIDNTGSENAVINSDVFRVQYMSRSSVTLSSDMADTSSNILLDSNIFGLSVDDIVSVGNCSSMDIFMVSGTSETPLGIGHTTSKNDSDNLNSRYDAGDTVRLLLSNSFFVGDTGRTNSKGDPIRALYRYDIKGNTEEIIEGVENMQILFGEEIAIDGCDRSTNQIRYVNSNDGTLDMSQVSVMKIGLLIASNEPVLSEDDNTIFQVLDQQIARTGTTITYDNDRRLRKAINTTINIRNRRTTKTCQKKGAAQKVSQ